MKGIYWVMGSRKGTSVGNVSNVKMPVGEKNLEKESWRLGNYRRVCAGKDLRWKKIWDARKYHAGTVHFYPASAGGLD